MNPPMPGEGLRLEELRRAFDQSFAAPARVEADDLVSIIGIRVSGEALALRADQITGIAKRRRIVPVPSRIPESLGITGMRGMLVPVFSLAALLGLERREDCAWLALAYPDAPVALAFDEFEGQTEVKRTSLYRDENASPRRYVWQLARIGPSIHAVVDIPSVVEDIRKAAERTRS
jgi:chemotaxis signal transduction protein